VFLFGTNCINMALVQCFWKKCVTPNFLKRYKFVTMFHEGANFWTSLCFQSALEAKLESWGTEKTFSTRKRVGFIAFLKTNLNQKIYGGYKRFGGLLLLNTLQDHGPA